MFRQLLIVVVEEVQVVEVVQEEVEDCLKNYVSQSRH